MAAIKIVSWVNFEDEVFNRVKRWLKAGHLCLSGIRAEVYRKRKYPSVQRKADIEFEVAIEAFDKGAKEPSLVWVWECKDNSTSGRRVEVKDVGYLSNQIDELGRGRFKASLVTTHGFQAGALELAKTNGISLFTLQKRMERVTHFERGAKAHEVEEIAVTEGFSWSGQQLDSSIWRFADVLSMGIMQWRDGKLPEIPAPIPDYGVSE